MSPAQQPADLLIRAGWIVPVEPRATVLADHAIALRDGRITALCPAAEADAIDAAARLDLPRHVLLPGLINAHGHAAMTLLRGYADDLSLMPWLEQYIWPVELTHVSPEFVADGARLAMTEMLLSGTTTFSDMYFFPDAVARVAGEAGLRCQLTAPIFDFPSAYGTGPDDYISKALALRDDWQSQPRINVAFGPHAPYTVAPEVMARVATYAAELDMAVQIHLHETRGEVLSHVEAHGERPVDTLQRVGLLGPRTQCVHMTDAAAQDIATLASAAAHVVHCPRSNMKLGSGICPVAALQQAGVNVALGTDGAASNNELSLFGEMHSAALLAKVAGEDPTALPAAAVLEAATLGGARALGLEEDIGSLVVGKQADLIAVDLSGPATQPVYNPLSQLVYTGVSAAVSHSWVAGVCLLHDRELQTIDVNDTLARARSWAERIAQ